MKFIIESKDATTKARAGIIHTERGSIHTPIFMPVGTLANVKGVFHRDLENDTNAEIILANTYHLYLRPGTEILEEAGGIHQFMNWHKPVLTDSGGFQVFSLASMRKIKPEGVYFSSHIDGSKHFFSPENVIDIQRSIGSDIMMAFDECTPYPCDKKYARRSLQLTHKWLQRCINRYLETSPKYGKYQSLFPIVQGSVYPDLRKESAEFVASLDMDGNAIGGLSVGEPDDLMYEMTARVCEILPENKPRYLMGVGTPVNILENIALGVDMFDCVMPTRNARNGMLFTSQGIINIRNEKWKKDFSPIDPNGTSFVDTYYSKAYLRHLFVSKEMLGPQIATLHNLAFYLNLVKTAREKIINGNFDSWKKEIIAIISRRL